MTLEIAWQQRIGAGFFGGEGFILQRVTGPGVVWLDDGDWLEAVTPLGVQNRGTRGEKKVAGASPVVEVVDWLKAETGGTVSAVGFTVEAKK